MKKEIELGYIMSLKKVQLLFVLLTVFPRCTDEVTNIFLYEFFYFKSLLLTRSTYCKYHFSYTISYFLSKNLFHDGCNHNNIYVLENMLKGTKREKF